MTEKSLRPFTRKFPYEAGTRYLILCLTCGVPLMQSSTDPAANITTNLLLRQTVGNHKAFYRQPHVVEKVDLLKNTSESLY